MLGAARRAHAAQHQLRESREDGALRRHHRAHRLLAQQPPAHLPERLARVRQLFANLYAQDAGDAHEEQHLTEVELPTQLHRCLALLARHVELKVLFDCKQPLEHVVRRVDASLDEAALALVGGRQTSLRRILRLTREQRLRLLGALIGCLDGAVEAAGRERGAHLSGLCAGLRALAEDNALVGEHEETVGVEPRGVLLALGALGEALHVAERVGELEAGAARGAFALGGALAGEGGAEAHQQRVGRSRTRIGLGGSGGAPVGPLSRRRLALACGAAHRRGELQDVPLKVFDGYAAESRTLVRRQLLPECAELVVIDVCEVVLHAVASPSPRAAAAALVGVRALLQAALHPRVALPLVGHVRAEEHEELVDHVAVLLLGSLLDRILGVHHLGEHLDQQRPPLCERAVEEAAILGHLSHL